MDVREQRRERRTLRGPLLARVHQPVSHDARFQVASDQRQHPRVVHPSCDPWPSRRRAERDRKNESRSKSTHHARVISDELACPLDSMMLRAPRPKAEAMGMEQRVEHGREHLARWAWQIKPIPPQPAPPAFEGRPRAWGSSPLRTGLRPVGTPPRALSGPPANGHANHGRSSLVLIPSMPGAPAFCSTRLSASARFFAGQELLPQARVGGVSGGAVRRRVVYLRSGWASSGFTVGPSPPGPRKGWLRSM